MGGGGRGAELKRLRLKKRKSHELKKTFSSALGSVRRWEMKYLHRAGAAWRGTQSLGAWPLDDKDPIAQRHRPPLQTLNTRMAQVIWDISSQHARPCPCTCIERISMNVPEQEKRMIVSRQLVVERYKRWCAITFWSALYENKELVQGTGKGKLD